MRKKMDEKKRKKYSKLYAYNINNQNNGIIKQMAFKNLDKDFYEDIINSDLDIKKIKKNLEGIKDGTIKESVYSNKNIPDVWKTKLSYRQEVHDAISNDENFAKYIGNLNEEEKVDFDFDNKFKTFSSTYYTNDESKSKNYLFEKTSRTNFDSIESNSDKNKSVISEKNEMKKGSKKKFFSSFGQPIINDKLIASKLDEYRIKFDMNNYMNEIRQKRDFEGKDKELKEMPNFLKERKRNYRNYLKSIFQNERVKVLRDAIYVNLLPPKDRLDEIDLEKNKKKKFNMNLPNKIKFLDSGSPEYDNPPKISDPRVRRDLELIDYYGPKYVHCKYCHRRNLEYYENSEPIQCLKLTGYLKKVRLGGDDNEEEKKEKK